jgi:hypothetical protein
VSKECFFPIALFCKLAFHFRPKGSRLRVVVQPEEAFRGRKIIINCLGIEEAQETNRNQEAECPTCMQMTQICRQANFKIRYEKFAQIIKHTDW